MSVANSQPVLTEMTDGGHSDHPFTEIQEQITQAVDLIESAADTAADLAGLGIGEASKWASTWSHLACLLTVPDGVKVAAKAEQEYLDDLSDREADRAA